MIFHQRKRKKLQRLKHNHCAIIMTKSIVYESIFLIIMITFSTIKFDSEKYLLSDYQRFPKLTCFVTYQFD